MDEGNVNHGHKSLSCDALLRNFEYRANRWRKYLLFVCVPEIYGDSKSWIAVVINYHARPHTS